MNVFEKISEQQKGKENTAVWHVGEQIKDIIKDSPRMQEIVSADLDKKEMSIAKCEEEIKAYAKSHGNCTPPKEADRIIREFYGITDVKESGRIDLADFFG